MTDRYTKEQIANEIKGGDLSALWAIIEQQQKDLSDCLPWLRELRLFLNGADDDGADEIDELIKRIK